MRHAGLAVAILGTLLPLACGRRQPPAPERAGGATAAPAASDTSGPIAEFKGGTIDRAEVDRRAAGSLTRLDYEIYEARRAALDEVLNERLLEKEAAARGMAVPALLSAEVEAKAKRPSSAEVTDFYAQNLPQIGNQPRDAVVAKIEQLLRERAVEDRRAAFNRELRRKASVRILLTAPRVEVPVPAGAPSEGPKEAPVTIVEFLDYQCPYCQKAEAAIDTILKRYKGKVRYVHRDFPLQFHPRAFAASQAVRCAKEQGKFWDYHQAILSTPSTFSEQELLSRAKALGLSSDSFSACLKSGRFDGDIRASIESGTQLGVTSTPTFFINGRRLVGTQNPDAFAEMIDRELAAR